MLDDRQGKNHGVPPETRYSREEDLHLAYQVWGDGPLDVLYAHGYGSHQDVQWEEPRFAHFLRRLGGLGRLITFDRRGSGLSDPMHRPPTQDECADDLRIVLDAVGAERAVVIGSMAAGVSAILFAAQHPERVSHLVLYAVTPRVVWAPDFPFGFPDDVKQILLETTERQWGTGVSALVNGRSMRKDERFMAWLSRYERAVGNPSSMRHIIESNWDYDVRSALPTITAPTLVVYRDGESELVIRGSQAIAAAIPRATLVTVPGTDTWPFVGNSDAIVDTIEEFLTGSEPTQPTTRVLRTVVFTDIVASTDRAAALGDRRWQALLESHDATVRREVDRFNGAEIKTTGDGFCITFDSPTNAVLGALAMRDAVGALGLETRAGVHAGEIEVRPSELAGIAVHVAARVASVAGPGEVFATSTVRDLTIGADLEFTARGEHNLKGFAEPWALFAASRL